MKMTDLSTCKRTKRGIGEDDGLRTACTCTIRARTHRERLNLEYYALRYIIHGQPFFLNEI